MKTKCHNVPQDINVENVEKRRFMDIAIRTIYVIPLDIYI